MGPHPAVAAARLAVRRTLEGRPEGPAVVACSGGADSLALAAATVFECRGRRRVLGVTVDHGLQEGSAEQARRVVTRLAALGADETMTVRVRVEAAGSGPEAAAREARYAVLEEVADRAAAAVVLLGHTLDDQAETVLLGLTRGSGGRSIAGKRRSFGVFSRPFLDLTREQTEQACRAQNLEFWQDPHNSDPRFTRARVRHRVLPVLEEELGPGVAVTLARTADLLREDMETLDRWADRALSAACAASSAPARPPGLALDVETLLGCEPAVRTRVLRLAAVSAGAPADEVFRVHVLALDALVTAWRGQRMVQLPGKVTASRVAGTLLLEPQAAVAG